MGYSPWVHEESDTEQRNTHTHFEVFIELITILFLFYVLFFGRQGMWDLSLPTRTEAPTPGLEGKVLTPGLLRNPPIIFFHFYVYIPHKDEIIQYLSLSV